MTLAPSDVLVEVEAAVFGAAEIAAHARALPFVPGGAAVGRVDAAGDAATHLLGARVLVGPFSACGECPLCRRGHPALCPARVRLGRDRDGALAGKVVTGARWLVPLTGALAGAPAGPESALMAREAPLAYELLVRAGVGPGDTTVWLGDPLLTGLGAALARAKGARAIVADDSTSAQSIAAGAPPGEETAPWRIFETSGDAQARERALALAPAGGIVGLLAGDAVGAGDEDDRLPAGAPLAREVTVFGVIAPHPDLVPEVVALVCRGELALAGLLPVTTSLPGLASVPAIWTPERG